MSHEQACPVGAERPEVIQGKNSGPIETISEVLGSYAILGGGYATRVNAYETASALASDTNQEMGMLPWYTSHGYHADLHKPCRTSFQVCCCHNRCTQSQTGATYATGMQPWAPGQDLDCVGI